jgi:5'-phosphate synthase pdxT subunit
MVLLADEVLDGRPTSRASAGSTSSCGATPSGRQVDSFETDSPFAGVGDVHAVFIRAPWVERRRAAQVLARVPDDGSPPRVGVVAVRQGSVWRPRSTRS